MFVFSILDSAHSIKCYVCDRYTDNCNDQVNPNGITTKNDCHSCMMVKGQERGKKGKCILH